MARWAIILFNESSSLPDLPVDDLRIESALWLTKVLEFTGRTRFMWRDGWFRDYDSVSGEWSSQQDSMHLAPIFCRASSQEHVEQLREALAQPPSHSSGWASLSWPPVVMTLVGAAVAAKMPEEAAELAYRFIDGSYTSIDCREPDEHAGLPGVNREYRQVVKVNEDGTYQYAGAGIE